MHTTRTTGRLLAALTVTAATAAISLGAASAAQAAEPETVMRYAVSTEDAQLTGGAGEAVYRTGPMTGTLDRSVGSAPVRTEEGDGVLLRMQPAESDTGLGAVTVEGTGTFTITPTAAVPPSWELAIMVDLTVTVETPPADWGLTAPATLRSTEQLKLSATLGSVDPADFTLTVGSVGLTAAETPAEPPTAPPATGEAPPITFTADAFSAVVGDAVGG
ncbi:MAG TPA: hypothetical protein VGF17_23460 [Phytomonospora sp.]